MDGMERSLEPLSRDTPLRSKCRLSPKTRSAHYTFKFSDKPLVYIVTQCRLLFKGGHYRSARVPCGAYSRAARKYGNYSSTLSGMELDLSLSLKCKHYALIPVFITLQMTTISKYENPEHAACYAKFRPVYPKTVADMITSFMKTNGSSGFKVAVDVACGSGQSTFLLCDYFEEVVGFDISEAQITQAKLKLKEEQLKIPKKA